MLGIKQEDERSREKNKETGTKKQKISKRGLEGIHRGEGSHNRFPPIVITGQLDAYINGTNECVAEGVDENR